MAQEERSRRQRMALASVPLWWPNREEGRAGRAHRRISYVIALLFWTVLGSAITAVYWLSGAKPHTITDAFLNVPG